MNLWSFINLVGRDKLVQPTLPTISQYLQDINIAVQQDYLHRLDDYETNPETSPRLSLLVPAIALELDQIETLKLCQSEYQNEIALYNSN